MQPSASNNSLLTPIAIIIGFAMIAIAIYFSGMGSSKTPTQPVTNGQAPIKTETADIRPVDGTDFVRGNPNAPIMIVEYSDYDCPFCQVFHQTMTQIINEYGPSGKVAWVYRQFPIPSLHPNAPKISEAALCVGDLAGAEAFWKFSDLVFGDREVNQPTNMTKLAEYATTAGADSNAFTTCLNSGRMKDAVDKSVTEAQEMGIVGTPHSVILVGNQQAVIEGAQPYTAVRQIIENLSQQLDGNTEPAAE
jgi:protein-disulfide isomerase